VQARPDSTSMPVPGGSNVRGAGNERRFHVVASSWQPSARRGASQVRACLDRGRRDAGWRGARCHGATRESGQDVNRGSVVGCSIWRPRLRRRLPRTPLWMTNHPCGRLPAWTALRSCPYPSGLAGAWCLEHGMPCCGYLDSSDGVARPHPDASISSASADEERVSTAFRSLPDPLSSLRDERPSSEAEVRLAQRRAERLAATLSFLSSQVPARESGCSSAAWSHPRIWGVIDHTGYRAAPRFGNRSRLGRFACLVEQPFR